MNDFGSPGTNGESEETRRAEDWSYLTFKAMDATFAALTVQRDQLSAQVDLNLIAQVTPSMVIASVTS